MASRIARLLHHHRRRLLDAAAGEASRRAPTAPRGFLSKDFARAGASSLDMFTRCMFKTHTSNLLTRSHGRHQVFPPLVRSYAGYSTQASEQNPKEERKDLAAAEDPFDDPTYHIPEKPVTFTEGASYTVVILAALGIAAFAGYALLKELVFEPKEYKIFGKALTRVQNDGQVTVRIGSPITGYGHETRNRAARQRIPHRVWTDENGVEHVEVNFHIRGPNGAGKVYAEMFMDGADRTWKFTYLIVEILSPHHAQLMLESYMPA